MWHLKSYKKMFHVVFGFSISIGTYTQLHASTDCVDQDSCLTSIALYQVDIGSKLLSKSWRINDFSCSSLPAEKSLASSGLTLTPFFERAITNNTQELIEVHQELENINENKFDNKHETTQVRTELAAQELLLDEALLAKDTARSELDLCIENKGLLINCPTEYKNYTDLRREHGNLDNNVFSIINNTIPTLSRNLTRIDKDIKTKKERIKFLNDSNESLLSNIESNNEYISSYMDNFDLFGETLNLNFYSHIPDQLKNSQTLVDVKLYLTPKEIKPFSLGKPLGIKGGKSILKNISRPNSIESLWPVMSSANDISTEFVSTLTTRQPLAILVDRYLSCAMGTDQTNEQYLHKADIALLYQLSQSQEILNTYEVNIEFSKVIEHLEQLANEYGYLSQSDIMPILNNELKGFSINIISEVDPVEAAKIPNQLQEDFLIRLLDSIALSAPKAFDPACTSSDYWCALNGWWLPNDASPVHLADKLSNNLLNDELSLIVESTVYMSKYRYKTIDINMSEVSLCRAHEISVDGLCIAVLPEQCSEGQEFIEGICTLIEDEQCPAKQGSINSICTDTKVQQCPVEQELSGGICTDILKISDSSVKNTDTKGGSFGYAIGLLLLLLIRRPCLKLKPLYKI